jgi:hypothetical protein
MTMRHSIALRSCLVIMAIGLLPSLGHVQDVPSALGTWSQEEGYAVHSATQIVAGRVGYMPGRWYQDVSPFYLERVRLGYYRWFPEILIPSEGVDSLTLAGYVGRDVLISGRSASIDIHPEQPMAIASILGLVTETIVPVENRVEEVIFFPELPCSLGEDEISVAFGVTNRLPYELKAARVIVDVEGPYQFGNGGKQYTYEQCKQWSGTFEALEQKEIEFNLVRADWSPRRDDTRLLMSIMFIGYARGPDGTEPIYALWKNRWPVMPASTGP